jgi:3'(2'), 5'-bisphosphate nucleotidase
VISQPGPVVELGATLRDVGALLLRLRRTEAASHGHWEGDQYKATADALAHDALAERLERLAPGVPVVSEEDPDSLRGERPRTYWLIDPLDGTASYAHGYPGYVTQAALMDSRGPVLAAIHVPERDVCFTADRDAGAWADGRPLPPLEPRQVGSGVLIDNTPRPQGVTRALQEAFGYSGYRESGSIALKLCAVAEGSAQLFVKDVAIRDWDVAPPHLLLRHTGAELRRLDVSPFDYRGGFEHRGLIAATPPTLQAVADWARHTEPTDGGIPTEG